MTSRRNAIILEELEGWREAGIIDEALYAKLRRRYETPGLDITTIIKWVLIFGAVVLGGGLVLLFSDVFSSLPDAAIVLMLTAVTAGFYVAGYRLTARHRQTLVYSGRALVFVGTVTTVVDLIWLSKTIGMGDRWPVLVAVAALIYFAVAYLMQDLLVLVFAVTAAAFWYGAQTAYLSGWGAYWLGLNYPLRFVGFSLLLLAAGWLHERQAGGQWPAQWREYGRIYLSLGLLCLFASLWLTSLVGNGTDLGQFRAAPFLARLGYVVLFTLGCIAAFAIGAKRHDRMFIAYGAIFLCINIYTRFFEHFWNALSKSLFFMALGALSLGIGIFLEYSRRNKLAARLVEE